MESHMFSYCLFCANSLSLHHPVKVEKSESENDGENESLIATTNYNMSTPQLEKSSILHFAKEEDSAIQVQLKAFFILRNVLNISKETLCQFLCSEEENTSINTKSGGDLWAQVRVCLSCEKLVSQYYRALKQTQMGMGLELDSELDRIGEELREKIRENKDVQVSLQPSIWARIRRHVLKRDFPDEEEDNYMLSSEPQVKLELTEAPNFLSDEEEWDISNTFVKVEIIDSAPTTFSTSFREGEERPPDSNKIPKQRHTQNYRHQCPHCPYKTGNTNYYESHLKIHFEGSPALPCVECGVHVLPKNFSDHRKCHRKKDRRINRNKNGHSGQLPPAVTTHPKILAQTQIKKWKGKGAKVGWTTTNVNNQPHLKCLDCPFMIKGSNSKLIESHISLHERGSGAIPCPECGCYQAAQSLESHRKAMHFPHLPRTVRKKLPWHRNKPFLTCPFCPFKHLVKKNFEHHLKYHEPESGAKACEECGIYVMPNYLRVHRRFCDFGIELNETTGGKRKFMMRHIDTSHPSYISFKRGKGKLKMYRCRKCTFQTNHFEFIQNHIELHEADNEQEVEIVPPTAIPGTHATDVGPTETVIKTEVVDLGYFSIPTFSMSDETELVQLPNSPQPPPEKDAFEIESEPIPILLTETCQTAPPILSGVEVKLPQKAKGWQSKYDHKCPYCRYTTGEHSLSSFEWHMKLHAKANAALVIPCPDCGVFIRLETLEAHREMHVRKAIRRAQQGDESSAPNKKKSKKKGETPMEKQERKEHLNPNPNFSSEQVGKNQVLHRCHHCAYTVRSSKPNILAHLKLHEPGSTAILCPEPECGIYVLPDKVKMHYGFHHRYVSKATQNKLKLIKRRMQKPPHNPDYLTTPKNWATIKILKSKLHKCRRCYFETKLISKMEAHVELHKEEDPGAGLCEECGVFMITQEVQEHLDSVHQKTSNSKPKYKCAECPYHTKLKRLYDHHLQLHCEGSQAIPCENCGCYISQQLVSHHRHFCEKWKTPQDTEVKVEVKVECE